MRARIFSALFLALLGLAGALAVPAQAQPGRDGIQPLDRLLPGIRRAHPGDFYDAEGPTYGPGGDAHYHLKWMTPDGRVIWYDADARSGRVLRQSRGRDSFDDERGYGPRAYPSDRQPYMGTPYDRGYGRMQREREPGGPAFTPRFGNGGNDWRGGGWRGGNDGFRGGREDWHGGGGRRGH